MTADLLERARSAVTPEQECNVIDDVLSSLWRGPVQQAQNLHAVVGAVRAKCLPRTALIGVVAALIPALLMRPVGPFMSAVVWGEGSTPALALLIAILEATHA